MGQQKVNKTTREHTMRPDSVWLNEPLRPAIASLSESPAVHF